MARTALLIKPSLEECQLTAAKIGLPIDQAEEFFYYNEARGWKMNGKPMICWKSAMQVWRIKWQARQAPKSDREQHWFVTQKEFERVLARMKAISDGYADHQNWSAKDNKEWDRLKARKTELMKSLGVII